MNVHRALIIAAIAASAAACAESNTPTAETGSPNAGAPTTGTPDAPAEPDAPTGPDTDGDGLSDAEETAGWTILVDAQGFAQSGISGETAHLEERLVTSDPDNADTDGDGLPDGEERRNQADPRRADTDGDGLTDAEEVYVYGSTPNTVDSDGDARGDDGTGRPNPRLFDGQEVARDASPILRDADADGISDYREIVDGGSHPGVADLPQIALAVVGAPNIGLNARTDESTGTSISATNATLEGRSTSRSSTDSTTNETALGFKQSVSATVGWSAGFSAEATASFEASQSFTNSSTHSTTSESARQSQQTYESARAQETSTGVSYEDGTIRVTLEIRNESASTSVNVADVRVIAKRFDPATSQMLPVAELTPATEVNENIAAGDGAQVVFEHTSVGTDDIFALLADPRAISFEVGRYAMSRIDQAGTPTADYAALAESMVRQNGLFVIDFGNGEVERHSVATNLERDMDGRPLGIPLTEALERTGTTPRITLAEVDGATVVTAIDDVANYGDPAAGVFGRWAVFSAEGDADPAALQLHHGDRVTFAFVQDEDGDGLWNREELLLGTNVAAVDTDGDGLCDGRLVAEGCTGAEAIIGTDPTNADTDGDGLADGVDPEPLVPAEGTGPTDPTNPTDPGDGLPTDGLVAHWEIRGLLGETWGVMIEDMAGDYDAEAKCSMEGGLTAQYDREGAIADAWDFAGHSSSGDYQCYADADVTMASSFTMSLWLRRSEVQTSFGFVAGMDQAAYLAIDQDLPNGAEFRIGERWDDDAMVLNPTSSVNVPTEDFMHLAITLDDDGTLATLRFYVDGVPAGELVSPGNALQRLAADGACDWGFQFGGVPSGCSSYGWEFSGTFDDVRLYDRALTEQEVARLFAE